MIVGAEVELSDYIAGDDEQAGSTRLGDGR